jgi:hypothetical protein
MLLIDAMSLDVPTTAAAKCRTEELNGRGVASTRNVYSPRLLVALSIMAVIIG